MDALIVAQARRAVSLLWDEVPTGTDPDELETSLCLHMASFQLDIEIHQPDPAELVSRVCDQAVRIYATDVRQIHHALDDELFLRYLIELVLVNLLGCPGDLRQRIKKHHHLLVSAVPCLPARLYLN